MTSAEIRRFRPLIEIRTPMDTNYQGFSNLEKKRKKDARF